MLWEIGARYKREKAKRTFELAKACRVQGAQRRRLYFLAPPVMRVVVNLNGRPPNQGGGPTPTLRLMCLVHELVSKYIDEDVPCIRSQPEENDRAC